MKIYQQYSKEFKFKYVTLYLLQKNKISLNSFAKTISGLDNENEIIQGSVNESTFRAWIKQHENYDCEDIFNLLSNSTNNNINIISNKYKDKNKKLKILKNTLPYINNFDTKTYENTSTSNELQNISTITADNKIIKKRMKYTYCFKKKWVLLYKFNLQKLSKLSLTYFAKLINGKDENNIINKGYVDESTFRKWIKL